MGLLKNNNFAILLAIIALSTASEARADGPYLTQGGPPPLRFSLAMANFVSLALPASLTPKTATTNTTQVAANKSNTPATNAMPQSIPSFSSSVGPMQLTSDPILSNMVQAPPAASDMLVVSPQMLTEYFKPGPDGTNSASPPILPVAVGFTPPSAKPTSRATYNSP